MRIGIACYPTYGGSGVLATELGKALADQGHEIHFITYKVPVRLNVLAKNIHFHEVNVSQYPLFEYKPYELVLTSKIVDVARYEKLDVLHVHYAIPHASAAYMAKEILKSHGINLPIITTLHGTDITLVGKDPSFEPVITFAINNSDAVTAVSDSLKNDTFKNFGVNRPIEVIHNFVNMEKYEDKPCKKHLFSEDGEVVISHVSNFRKVKRIQDIIHSFKLVREKVNAKLLLVGEGPERNQMEKLCRDLKICDQVHFLGNIQNVEEVLCLSDIFMLTSESESFGLAALEAMAAKNAVISSNTGGIPEVNEHGVTGYLSKVGDIEDLAKNTIELIEDREKLEQFKKNAYEKAKTFDISQIMPIYLELYDRVLASQWT